MSSKVRPLPQPLNKCKVNIILPKQQVFLLNLRTLVPGGKGEAVHYVRNAVYCFMDIILHENFL